MSLLLLLVLVRSGRVAADGPNELRAVLAAALYRYWVTLDHNHIMLLPWIQMISRAITYQNISYELSSFACLADRVVAG